MREHRQKLSTSLGRRHPEDGAAPASAAPAGAAGDAAVAADLLVLGRRLRSARRQAGLTLDQLGSRVGRPASYLSQVENGHREPKLATLRELSVALAVPLQGLLDPSPPDRRTSLELRLREMQADPAFTALRLPELRPGAGVDDVLLQHVVTLYERLVEVSTARRELPEGRGARRANAAMRDEMRARDNYYGEIEQVAGEAVAAAGVEGPAALSERALSDLAAHFGFSIERVPDLPASTRSISDLCRRVIYVAQRNDLPPRAARSVVAQTLGHFALGHRDPGDFEEYVRQRVEANYFAGALLAPERAVVELVDKARREGDISISDLRDVFYISYEMAAHRLTNLITRHFSIPVHFQRSDPEGVLWKAYENDGVPLAADADGTVEGQLLCRWWSARQAFDSDDRFGLHYQHTETPAGTFWCVTSVEADGSSSDAVTFGTPERFASVFRGHDTARRAVSSCPDPGCCRQPTAAAAQRWAGSSWASARDRSRFVSGLPADATAFDSFPGVGAADVYEFLDRHAAR